MHRVGTILGTVAQYPKEFSREVLNRIGAAKLDAYRELQRAREKPPPEGFTVPQADRFEVIAYVFKVVFAFAAEARECVRHDALTIIRTHEEIMRFAGAFAEETSAGEAGYDRRGQPIASLVTFNGHYVLRPELERELYEMPEWQAHVRDLRKIVRRSTAVGPVNLHAEVRAFIDRFADSGHKIERQDIWLVMGHKSAREFQRVQSGDPKATKAARTALNRVLAFSPEQFLEILKKKKATQK
jgi:hypothetical protein